ncbi:MAG: GDP-mannose 4,6-dehydratase, partial [Sphingomicrobium sp.]
MRVLLTGGTGYIGSHAALAVLEAGHEPVLFDDFSNSRPYMADRLSELAGRPLTVVRGDVRDRQLLESTLSSHRIDAVMHFAGRKSVAESVADPLAYHAANVGGLLALVSAMENADVRAIVFSSSAMVYGDPPSSALAEDHPTAPANPYG